MFFNARNKGIETKLAEKMGIEHPAEQLSCDAHTALAWLYMTSILLLLYLL